MVKVITIRQVAQAVIAEVQQGTAFGFATNDEKHGPHEWQDVYGAALAAYGNLSHFDRSMLLMQSVLPPRPEYSRLSHDPDYPSPLAAHMENRVVATILADVQRVVLEDASQYEH